MDRITKDELYMEAAKLLAKRSKCKRLQVGCVIIKDKRIISSGCNGILDLPGSVCWCEEGTKCGDLNSIHAEANAIAFAAKEGLRIDGCTVFVTHSPCQSCAKLIVAAGIKQVIYLTAYRDATPLAYLKSCGVATFNYNEI